MSTVEELISKSQTGDMEAKERLVIENSGLIWSIARRYFGRGVEPDDLYQLGCLGFIKAVDGFDVSFGTQFSTYAVPKIAGEIRRFIRDDGAVKVSRSIKERASLIKSVRNELIRKLGREPSVTEISEATDLSPEDIAMAESATANVESIHQEAGEDGFTLEHVLSDTKPEDSLLEEIALHQAVADLPEREKMVISLRYFHAMTQQNVAKIMKISQVQVSRIEKKTLQILRQRLG